MISAVLVFNHHGRPRLTKWYEQKPIQEQQMILHEIFNLVSARPDDACNVLEGSEMLKTLDARIIYRHYATLYFVFLVDYSESELGILDLIQVFVEVLDRTFVNVCELDLVFQPEEVSQILSEVVSGGMVTETRISEIMAAVDTQTKSR